MGFAKRQMQLEQDQWIIAQEIAVDAGVLKRCEFHSEVYGAPGDDNTPAYIRGNRLFSSGELNGVFSDRREMTDAIKAAIEDSAMECGYCAKWRND
ncbi:hypothetical protein [Acidicapsa acidisoli]|uniref:hypothetical protein n=1 Tax=Acidicapsa acidisoli TaxID=1615681 RepID=UPI0021E012D9|nr:hypothetical protein [Acidicapsa acidisoli]